MVVLIPQKIVLVLVDEKKYPKKIVLDPAKVKKGDQNRGTYVSPITSGVPPRGGYDHVSEAVKKFLLTKPQLLFFIARMMT